MSKFHEKIELLAPAKDKESAFCAINAGADAIYIGANRFGARKNASNSIDEIKEIVDFAHLFNVKVYVTINTILTDDEIKDAVNLINELYEIKVDAVIVQDMGLLECDLPPIKLFASTQCHNNDVEKVKFFEKTGLTRVILARELSVDEIKKISSETNVHLEAFVHGALCVSYSGQCYLSQFIGQRSANRGECAQPCRKKYKLVDKNEKVISDYTHLLCLKDFNASNSIEHLLEAGISSFKIEGRLKDTTYITNIISFYRQKLDSVLPKFNLKKSSFGETLYDFEPNPEKTFNRGYTEYFLHGRDKNITSFLTPKSKGELVGQVIEIDKNRIKIKGKILNVGDGICYFDKNNSLAGTTIIAVEKNFYKTKDFIFAKKNSEIYRNKDVVFEKQLANSKLKRRLRAQIEITEKEKFLIFSITDEMGVKTCLEIENDFELAQNVDNARENLKKQFSKTGNTIFNVEMVEIKLENMPFIKVSEMNAIRSELVEKLIEKKLSEYKPEAQLPLKVVDYYKDEIDYRGNVFNLKAKEFYEKRNVKVGEFAFEKNANGKKAVMTTKHCLRYSFDLCKKCKNNKNFAEPFYLIDECGKKYELEFDCKNCEMKIFN